jgi:hypothetical protein
MVSENIKCNWNNQTHYSYLVSNSTLISYFEPLKHQRSVTPALLDLLCREAVPGSKSHTPISKTLSVGVQEIVSDCQMLWSRSILPTTDTPMHLMS